MTWLARLSGGPLDGGSVRVPNQIQAYGFEVGGMVAIYAHLPYSPDRLDAGSEKRPPAGELRYAFESVRALSERERRLYGLAPLVEFVA